MNGQYLIPSLVF